MAESGVGTVADGWAVPDHHVWPAEAGQLAAMRAEVHRWLAPFDLPDDADHDLILAVNEAATNAIEHDSRGTRVVLQHPLPERNGQARSAPPVVPEPASDDGAGRR